MSQVDRHKDRVVQIDFYSHQDLQKLVLSKKYTLALITENKTLGTLNGYPVQLESPCVLCLQDNDDLKIDSKINASVFCFDPIFLETVRVSQLKDINVPNTPHIKKGLSLFAGHDRIISLDAKIYPKFLQWFFTMGMEVSAQSDDLWVCRIKQYLIQIFNLLLQLKESHPQSAIDIALKFIHMNYSQPIKLDDLTDLVHLNRVSMNEQFKQRVNQTAMQYLLSYRLSIAEQMLTHTGMTLNDIALATGFEYDTYFMKQFRQHKGMSPTQYRNVSREVAVQQ